MAVTVPLNTGKARTSGAASLAVSFGSLPSSGDAIIVCVSALLPVSLEMASANVTDNQSGTYGLDKTAEVTATYYAASGVWSDLNIAAPTGTFTITYDGTGNPATTMGAIAVRSLATASALDAHTSGTGTSTTPSSGTTGATAQADEIAVAAFTQINGSGSGQTVTDPSGYTPIYNEGDASAYAVSGAAYKVLSATGTQSASWSVTGTGYAWSAIIATYKGATVQIQADVSQTLASLGQAITATVAVSAGVTQVLADAPCAATATVLLQADVSQTLADVTPAVTGTVTVTADVAHTLASLTHDITGTVALTGAVSQTLAAITPAVTATVQVKAATSQALNAVTIAATATVTSTGPIILYPSTYIPAGGTANTTGQLTPPVGKTVNGYFQAGKISDDTNPLPSVNPVIDNYTELEWCIAPTTDATHLYTYQFRVTANGTALTTYAVTPTLQYLVPANATVTQTLDALGINATAQIMSAGTAIVNQTLLPLEQDITAIASRAVAVDVTLGSVSQPKLKTTTTDLTGGVFTGFNFYFGRSAGTYTAIVPYATSVDVEIPLASIAPDTGEWYVMFTAYNADGESSASNEVFVVVPTFTVSVANPIGFAVVTQTLNPVALAAAAKVLTHVSVAPTLAAITPTITTTVLTHAAVAQTLQAVTPSVAAAVAVTADVTQTLNPVAIACAVGLTFDPISATVAQTLGEVTIQATGLVYNAGRAASVAQTLGSIQAAVTTAVRVTADVTQTLNEVAIAAAASAFETGTRASWVDVTLAPMGQGITAEVDIAAEVDALLAEIACAAKARHGVYPWCPPTIVYVEDEVLCRS